MKPVAVFYSACVLVGTLAACTTATENTRKPAWQAAYESDKAMADTAFDRGDYATALEIYTLHARLGSTFAQHRLAVMYAHGLGVDVNLVDAYMWAHLSASENSPPLVEYRNALAEQLSTAQLTEAQSKALVLFQSQNTYSIIEKTYLKETESDRDDEPVCTGSLINTRCKRR